MLENAPQKGWFLAARRPARVVIMIDLSALEPKNFKHQHPSSSLRGRSLKRVRKAQPFKLTGRVCGTRPSGSAKARETPRTKLQSPGAGCLGFEVWCFPGAWGLDV